MASVLKPYDYKKKTIFDPTHLYRPNKDPVLVSTLRNNALGELKKGFLKIMFLTDASSFQRDSKFESIGRYK